MEPCTKGPDVQREVMLSRIPNDTLVERHSIPAESLETLGLTVIRK